MEKKHEKKRKSAVGQKLIFHNFFAPLFFPAAAAVVVIATCSPSLSPPDSSIDLAMFCENISRLSGQVKVE